MVVMEIKPSSGGVVRIHDDAYAGVPDKEMKQREAAIGDVILRIYENAARSDIAETA